MLSKVDSSQLLLVISPDWQSNHAHLFFCEKMNGNWIQKDPKIPVVIGKNGLAWGRGIYEFDEAGPIKKEGDLCSTAGLFYLGPAFGKKVVNPLYPFIPINEYTEAVDDSKSKYYNQIVDSSTVKRDWGSSEKMNEIKVYEYGIIIEHNFPEPKAQLGSAIFIHLWESSEHPTVGCTAMEESCLLQILRHLDMMKKPIICQVTQKNFEKYFKTCVELQVESI